MKKVYEDAEVMVTKFEYEEVMISVEEGGIPDTGEEPGEGEWQ